MDKAQLTANKPQPKRHHYLPQKYQQGFSRDGNLWLFDRKLNQFRNQAPVNTCLEKHFYSVEDYEGNKHTEVEVMTCQIEGRCWPLIEKLEARREMTTEDRMNFSEFVALMWFRTPEFQRMFNEMNEGRMRRFTQHMFATVEDTQRMLNIAPRDERVTPEEIHEFVQGDEYRMRFHRNASLKMMVDLIPELTPEIMAHTWMVFHATSNTSFITSDVPFIIMPPQGCRGFGIRGYGLRTPGSVKIFPLSQRACLIMGDVIRSEQGLLIQHRNARCGKVKEVNMALASKCERFCLGRDEAQLRSLVARTGIDKTQPGPKTNLPFRGACPE